jgi:ATP-dependent helicase HrpB
VTLHGDLSPQEQDAAVQPGQRSKVILSTNVAESSVTIEGVVAVIDSGLSRVASQSPWSGLPRLRVEKISRASAIQRAGRAGRIRPGRCLRLYTRADFETRKEHDIPEIRRLDLTQTRLELAALGSDGVPWLEAPPEAHMTASEALLRRLGALDDTGRVTDTGQAMLRFAVHPRVARVVVQGWRHGAAEETCLAAAILSEGDPRATSRARFGDTRTDDRATDRSDATALVELIQEAQEANFAPGALRAAGLDSRVTHAIARAASQLARALPKGAQPARATDPDGAIRRALLAGYPDRVARRVRAGGRQLALAGGGSAELSPTSVVRDAEWLVAIDAEERSGAPGLGADRSRGGVVVRLASAIDPEWLMDLFPGDVQERREVGWDPEGERVMTRETLSWEGLVLYASEPASVPSDDASHRLAEAALAAGAATFAPHGALDAWLARVRFASTIDPTVPAPDDNAVRNALAEVCVGRTRFAELRDAGLLDTLRQALGARLADVNRLAPERVVLAGGRSVGVRYDSGKPPGIASRMQDFFGMVDGPRVASGKVPLVLELLAPNGRAVQVTTDLAGFWQRHYPALRKELMRRYPKHAWPEDPTASVARTRERR